MNTRTLGKHKDRTADNEEVSHAENEPVEHENARARCLQTYQTKQKNDAAEIKCKSSTNERRRQDDQPRA